MSPLVFSLTRPPLPRPHRRRHLHRQVSCQRQRRPIPKATGVKRRLNTAPHTETDESENGNMHYIIFIKPQYPNTNSPDFSHQVIISSFLTTFSLDYALIMSREN